ncbi:NAD(P)-dependent oxidoreductase [Shewanella inventionis]|uniref:NAD(P)-dependent oxidoreductase n=1 Tax=Shewanella phaeophyticola TaxID=2978345 RepID=A0ABT2P4J0_9GAMM|nr:MULTISPECIES: NAD(P)-dependent oxidoreductase [Shewanella]MCT8987568.1 NAD(P)-dependent oxidoreductase [Shewanella sp. KJ10-1]UAL44480.1 NAD(P)-dependent oxidoreductase [Shewanella inventionis]
MKLAVLGATGWIGGTITQEAIGRGHDVVAVVRDASKVTQDINVRTLDITQMTAQNVATAFADVDVVIASVSGRAAQNHDVVAQTAAQLLQYLPQAGSPRLLWVGGAGSLEVAPGVTLVSTPEFPEEYKAEAIAQGEALAAFRATKSAINWTFVSPAAMIFPGESEAPYRLGGDEFFTDAAGQSRVSVVDFAKAMVDEAENAKHINQRISVAY